MRAIFMDAEDNTVDVCEIAQVWYDSDRRKLCLAPVLSSISMQRYQTDNDVGWGWVSESTMGYSEYVGICEKIFSEGQLDLHNMKFVEDLDIDDDTTMESEEDWTTKYKSNLAN